MDNEEDYIELHKLLAKCKFNLQKERAKFNPNVIGHSDCIRYYEEKLKQIDKFIVDIPIIIKGDEF